MSVEPFVVDAAASLERVAREMARHKYGCAVVRENGGDVVGVFTTTDALAVLARLLREKPRAVRATRPRRRASARGGAR